MTGQSHTRRQPDSPSFTFASMLSLIKFELKPRFGKPLSDEKQLVYVHVPTLLQSEQRRTARTKQVHTPA